jgi:hypothetical protein
MTRPSSFAGHSGRLRAFIERGGDPAGHEFSELARGLFALQFAHVTPYRALCEARGVTPESLADWRQIAAVPTAAFKELELTSLAPAERAAVFHSSGTTEHRPSRHFHSAKSLAVYEASLRPWFARHLLGRAGGWQPPSAAPGNPSAPGETNATGGDCKSPARFLCLAPPPEQAPHSSLVHMFACVSAAFGGLGSRFLAHVGADNAWALDTAAAFAALREAEQAGKPVVLLGTAFMFVHLLDEFAARGQSPALPPGSRVMETGGYKGRSRELPKAELHALITARLGVPREFIVCEYGMSELSSQAYDGVAGDKWQVTNGTPAAPSRTTHHAPRVFHFPPWCRALVVSPETGREVAEGETGLLRVFDLANVRSVMAIQTEDLAVRRGEGFELLGRAARAEARGCSLLAA